MNNGFVDNVRIVNDDGRRSLKEIYNGDFASRQLIELEVKADSWLGGHYHEYEEIFYLQKGELDYIWINVDTGERKDFKLKAGQKARIPPRTYHRAFVRAGSVIIGSTEEPFISPEKNNLPYKERK